MADRLEALKRKLGTLESSALSVRQCREAALTMISDTVPFAAACCTSVDPVTLLSTGSSTDDVIEAIHHQLFAYEYGHGHEDYNSYEHLIHAPLPAASLSAATEGMLSRSGRFREVLAPAGFGDELRAVLLNEGACWGYLTLFRRTGEPAFREEERLILAAIAPGLAKSIKNVALKPSSSNITAKAKESGILILTDSLELSSSNASGAHWLAELRKLERIDAETLPRPLRAVCSRALVQSREYAASTQMNAAKVCLLMPDGLYLAIEASKLENPFGLVQLAVTMVPAKPADILPLITHAYALTAREYEVTERIIKGFSTKEMAQSLHISAYTVQDHLKSIFVKMGVNSRRELLRELVSKHS